MKKSMKRRQGQGITEYVIIVGLIAILLTAAVTRFKGALEGAYDASKKEIDTEITAKIK